MQIKSTAAHEKGAQVEVNGGSGVDLEGVRGRIESEVANRAATWYVGVNKVKGSPSEECDIEINR
jgi:hypothetical protein